MNDNDWQQVLDEVTRRTAQTSRPEIETQEEIIAQLSKRVEMLENEIEHINACLADLFKSREQFLKSFEDETIQVQPRLGPWWSRWRPWRKHRTWRVVG